MSEAKTHQAIYDLPERVWYKPEKGGPDLSVSMHGMKAGTPVGPAAGPHTQMAQNIVLAYVAGGRIFELKTVQIMDRLPIPRPCIDVRNIGYNAEWSQELRIEESIYEYCVGAYLISILRGENILGCENPLAPEDDPVIWDISVGYDLKGIKSRRVVEFLKTMMDATAVFDRLDEEIPAEFAHLKKHRPDPKLSRSATLSTFHGCPPKEIEGIVEFLLEDIGLHTIVKMNPTMLGRDGVEGLLRETLGYKELRTNPHAYEVGLPFDESLEMMRRLKAKGDALGLHVGAKFSNTLEVINDEGVLPKSERVIYLSGAPLHVITSTLAAKWRDAMDWQAPLSFSAGVDAANFPDMVACGCTPITTCTDLLKPGGYGRMTAYLENLKASMAEAGAGCVADYIRHRAGLGVDVSLAEATAKNWRAYAEAVQADDRYSYARNSKEPKKIKPPLEFFDCINCDKCIPVCPNDAMFSFEIVPGEFKVQEVQYSPDFGFHLHDDGVLNVKKEHQLANFADWCNECSNCQTYCPQPGGPQLVKPRFFNDRLEWQRAREDGFFMERRADADWCFARYEGREYEFEMLRERNRAFLRDEFLLVEFDTETHAVVETHLSQPLGRSRKLDTSVYHVLRLMVQGVLRSEKPNPVTAVAGT